MLDRIMGIIAERREYWSIKADDLKRLNFYQTLVRSGNLVFDVGANLGNRTKTFAVLGATVVAIEPLPDLARRLKRLSFGCHSSESLTTRGWKAQGRWHLASGRRAYAFSDVE